MQKSCLTLGATSALFALVALSPALAQTVEKHPVCGLATMGNMNFSPTSPPTNALEEANAHPGIYKSAVVIAEWSKLEPSPGVFDYSQIDSALATIATYNSAHPQTPMTASLTIFGALEAPLWAQQLDGGPVSLTNSTFTGTIGHFWSLPYRNAWQQLQTALASRYDSDPRIQQVQISSCSSDTAEPFVLDSVLPTFLQAEGFNDAAYLSCLQGAEADYAAWTVTPLYFPFNPFVHSDPGHQGSDPAATIAIMQKFRADLGARGVIGNNALIAPYHNASTQAVYQQGLAQLGPSMTFQFYSPKQDAESAVQLGFQTGMTELELWDSTSAHNGSFPVTTSQLQTWASQFTCPSQTDAPCGSTASGVSVNQVVSTTTGLGSTNQCPFGGSQPVTTTVTQEFLCTNGTLAPQGAPVTTTVASGAPLCSAAASCGNVANGASELQIVSQTTTPVPASSSLCSYGGNQPATTVVTQQYLCTNGSLAPVGSPVSTVTDNGKPSCNAPASCGSTKSGATTVALVTTEGSIHATTKQCAYGGTQATKTVVRQTFLCTNGTLSPKGAATTTTVDTGKPSCTAPLACGSTPSGSIKTDVVSSVEGTQAATKKQCILGGTQPITTTVKQTYLCVNGNFVTKGAPVKSVADAGAPACNTVIERLTQ